MLEIKTTLSSVEKLADILRAEMKKENKALQTAVRVEGYGLRKRLMADLRTGAFGIDPLTNIGSVIFHRTKTGRLAKNRPLAAMAKAVRYRVEKEPFVFAFGWTGNKLSKSWKRIALAHETGSTRPVTDAMRRYFAFKGASMSKRSRSRKFFFLKKTTTVFHLPARPTLDPFWQKHADRAWTNIRSNWRKKLAGERI